MSDAVSTIPVSTGINPYTEAMKLGNKRANKASREQATLMKLNNKSFTCKGKVDSYDSKSTQKALLG